MAAVGLPATRSHDAEWLFFFGRVLYKPIMNHLHGAFCVSSYDRLINNPVR